jgi:signal transduction histidine kinase
MRGTVEILEEAFRQVVDNAIRYGARGKSVTIQASATATHVTVQVTDRGPGIPKEDVPFIFQPFYVVGQDPDTQAQGGGLGLCLARGVMDVHGGSLECDSGRGGTTMTLRFPRDFQRETAPSTPRTSVRRRKHPGAGR